MRLSELIDSLSSQPAYGTIFAQRIDGRFLPESSARVVEFALDDRPHLVDDIARELGSDMEYLLELGITRRAIAVLEEMRGGPVNSEEATAAVIYTSEYETYYVPEGLELPAEVLIHDDHGQVLTWLDGSPDWERLKEFGVPDTLLHALSQWADRSPGLHDKWDDDYVTRFDDEGRAVAREIKAVVGLKLRIKYGPLGGDEETIETSAG